MFSHLFQKSKRCLFGLFIFLLSVSYTHSVEVPTNVYELPPISNFREGANGLAYPHMPPFRTTIDGRIGMRVTRAGNLQFFLITPELIDNHLLLSDRGVQGVSEQLNIPVRSVFELSNGQVLFGRTICEKQPTNPQPTGTQQDRYEFTVVGTASDQRTSMTMMSADFVAIINNPKTADASIESIEFVEGSFRTQPLDPSIWGVRYVEPNITRDGLLLMVKLSALVDDLVWDVPGSPRRVYARGGRPTMYSYNSTTDQPCDISGWTQPHPISHAFHDTRINQKYGFAQYQLRDSEGNLIGDGEQISASQYPWLSQDGTMVFMELGGSMLHYINANNNVVSRYPRRCGDPNSTNNCRLNQGGGNRGYIRRYENERNINRNVVAFGSWTHGKMVEIDNIINYMDYGPNGADRHHLLIDLYEPGTGASPSDVNDSGRVLIAHNKQTTAEIPLSVDEGAQLGSIENRFNFDPNWRPITPRDIVWQVSKGNGVTAEVAFDDFIDPNVFIYAPMNTSFENLKYRIIDERAEIQGYNDGFRRTGIFNGRGFIDEVHYQNAATADNNSQVSDNTLTPNFFDVPDYGVGIGNIRIEPVALGGIRGKGAWLSGSNGAAIRFDIASQPKTVESYAWYYGIFVDPRSDENRRLLTFPNGADLRVDPGDNQVIYATSGSNRFHDVTLPENILNQRQWMHIGLKVRETEITLYINGNLVDVLNFNFADDNVFYLRDDHLPGELFLGANSPTGNNGYLGWLDDFKMIHVDENDLSEEIYCEHARGTLVSLDDNYEGPLTTLAMNIDSTGGFNITQELLTNDAAELLRSRYACYVDYSSLNGATLAEIPSNSHSLRQALLSPQPLVFGEPRPDETMNTFCISCHVDEHPVTLNRFDALSINSSLNLEVDRRRQPVQPLPLMYGVIPAGFFGSEPTTVIESTDGIFVDKYTNPN